ncbi:hypothetical protein BDV95DRAFT_607105 [Massariosphaeria phaeospora]|uniref:Uncharacterized protein n=1 Tax=Massariosphaeria phaeospora TaxID=100035 RepID=A0A7C8I612_9PLEO|nr:hypothetical protein BDV95DRAFT_607105 [Massariosphaeria phaeospora]
MRHRFSPSPPQPFYPTFVNSIRHFKPHRRCPASPSRHNTIPSSRLQIAVLKMERPNATELAARNVRARVNLQLKLGRLGDRLKFPRNRDTFYFKPTRVYYPGAPPDLQLGTYFRLCNDVARGGFRVKSNQESIVNSLVWYYGLDEAHSFSSFFKDVRYNVFLMAFVWASGSDATYCPIEAHGFIVAYIEAWMEGLVEYPEQTLNAFTARHKFITMWGKGTFDLIHFNRSQQKKVQAKITEFNKLQIPLDRLPTPANFVNACKQQMLLPEDLQRFGPALAYQWLLAMRTEAETKQEEIDTSFEDQMENVHELGRLWDVPWDTELIQGLLVAVDRALPPSWHPDSQAPRDMTETPWMSGEALAELLKADSNINNQQLAPEPTVDEIASLFTRTHIK